MTKTLLSKTKRKLVFGCGYIIFHIFNQIDIRYIWKFGGNIFEKIRFYGLNFMGADLHPTAIVRANSKIYFPQNLQMGEHSQINVGAKLFLYESLRIGKNVEIGAELLVYTGEHHFSDKTKPLVKQGGYWAPVSIEDDVYIGSRVTILKGVKIASRVIVAAGSVVTKNLESGYIYGGVPAKKIKPIP